MTNMELTRRSFVVTTAAAGGGLMLGVGRTASAATVNVQPWTTQGKEGTEINQWVSIDPEGTITIRVAAPEFGSDALTSGAMMLAEELPVVWGQVRAVVVDSNRHIAEGYLYGTDPFTMNVVASVHVRRSRELYMQAGASARERLKLAAAQAWGVDPSQVTAKDSVLSSGSHSGTFAEFATAAAQVQLPQEPAIKTPDEYTLMGTSMARLDTPLKVNGSAQFGIDARLPGMVYAAIQASPVPGGTLKSFDFDAIADRPGVIQAVELRRRETDYDDILARERPWGSTAGIRMTSAIVVVADTWYRAKTALELMPVQWDDGPGAGTTTESLYAASFALLDQPDNANVKIDNGDAMAVISRSNNVLTADFQRPFISHSPMEPQTATASLTADRLDIWDSSQSPVTDVDAGASQASLDPSQVFVHVGFVGGGFGRRGGPGSQTTRQAVEIAKQTGRPVKLVWTREEDTMQNFMRGMAVDRFTAAIGADGLPDAVLAQSAADAIYSLNGPFQQYEGAFSSNLKSETHVTTSHIPMTYLRSVATGVHDFMTEQFVDKMALSGGWDPLEFRLELTKDDPQRQLVLETLRSMSGFTTDLPKGEGMGVALLSGMYDFIWGTIMAHAATVSVSRRGQLRVEKIDVVASTGHILNPRGAIDQLQGAVIYELSHVLRGGIDIQNGAVVTKNFDTYQLTRIADAPEINVQLVPWGDKTGGIGELGSPPTGPAIANAIYFATGKRARSTPLINHDLSWS
jgi:isoquinoline 1-oxidoreductase beta subunit